MKNFKGSYIPAEIEDKWYSFWEKNGYFIADVDSAKPPFCIVIPPPNVTGSLHMGHALNATIQDILARWKRMSGYNVLWLPGTDHAGIATQNVVERELSKEGIDRHKLGRDAFIERVWKWKSEYGRRIIYQLKKLGTSCDWSRERFTLDEGLSSAVREVFVRLFEDGLIYRDARLINWCPRCRTALSDLEVEYKDLEGKLYFIKYPLAGEQKTKAVDCITVATTRPETMLGDTAVAVHLEDERYKHIIGKVIDLPLVGRKIPIIADPDVDPAFGTGAVKITPAHDFNDEITGNRHKLPFISVITEDGSMSKEAGERYFGLDRYECRKRVINDLKELELLEGEKRHNHSVGHCYRCKTAIEPFLTIQWYVKTESIASEAVKAVSNKSIRFIPESWENNYFAWMKDIKDWCISRQIWWGHQIPVWYCPDCTGENGKPQGEILEHIFYEPVKLLGGRLISSGTYSELRLFGLSHDEIIRNSRVMRISKNIKPICSRHDLTECPECSSKNIIRDPDVLDTWFSSALWPFSTLGWPNETNDLKTFYPTSVLVTGFDIIFFWVARMIMMGMRFMGDVPFRDVYIHALVRDLKGQKMSKSKGNVVDPLVVIEKYGADAFRFTLAAFAAQGRDVRFSEDRVEGYRHFINKLWNATKFIINAKNEIKKPELQSEDFYQGIFKSESAMPERWILSRLAFAAEEANRNLKDYRFNDAAGNIYHFVWHEFCDWYIEIVKPVLYQGSDDDKVRVVNCLIFVLQKVLKLLHPFIPFVTEEIWNEVFEKKESIMLSSYPMDMTRDIEAEEKMNHVIDAVAALRSIRGELNIQPSIRAGIKTLSKDAEEILKMNVPAIMKLTRCSEINIGEHVEQIKGSAVSVKENMEIYVPIEGLLDIEAEIKRLQKELDKSDDSIAIINKKLLNEDFLKNAPKDVVEKEKNKFDDLIQKKTKIEENLRLLKTVI